MSARGAWTTLAVACALAGGGCIEPSAIDNADEVFAAVSARDGGAGPASAADSGAASTTDGGGGSAGAASSDCAATAKQYIAKTCTSEFCHGKGTTSPLSLSAADVPTGLVGKSASMICDGEVYVDPAVPEQSLLYTKLSADPPCGSRMPLGGTPATAAQLACILEWLTDAAAAAPASTADAGVDAGM